MWLSQRQRKNTGREREAQVGTVTLSGDPAGVYLAGELRGLPVFGPGGYCWRPDEGEQVLVIKTGEAGEVPCVAGTRCTEEETLGPGEICIRTADGMASLRLEPGGVIRLDGTLMINGELYIPPEPPPVTA